MCLPQVPSVCSKDKNKSRQEQENGQSHTTNRQVRWPNEREARVTLFFFFFFPLLLFHSHWLFSCNLFPPHMDARLADCLFSSGLILSLSLSLFPAGSLCMQGHPITPAAVTAAMLMLLLLLHQWILSLHLFASLCLLLSTID